MRKITDVQSLEAIVGTPPEIVLMKQVDTLDEGCRSVLDKAAIAGFGFRDREGIPHTTIVGGAPGFARVDSPTRLSFDLPVDGPAPEREGGASFVFLVTGVGETLRLNGFVTGRSGTHAVIDVEAAYVHCVKCIRRSRLWEGVRLNPAPPRVENDSEASGPLADDAVAGFLASSSFLALSSWDAVGSSDTSPRGDAPGFLRILDGHTLGIPHRKGNKRNDTFHNLLTCDQISLAALVPGRDDVLHLSGTGYATDEPALLSTMAVKEGERPPAAALIVRVQRAGIVANEAVRLSRMWEASAHVDPSQTPDMNRVAAQHIAHNKTRSATASMARVLSKGLAALPSRLVNRAMDVAYRKDLKDEGY